ncbi:carotenoid cleavage dioxygenase 4 [Dionaea muscipula]
MDALFSSNLITKIPHKNPVAQLKASRLPIPLRCASNSEPTIRFLESSSIAQASSSSPSPAPFGGASSQALKILNVLEDVINKFIDPPQLPWIDPDHVLSGNFAPVPELDPTECNVIEGVLPACLEGTYIRNGPNPHLPQHGPYHLFDGDGMLHCLRISGTGRVTFCSRYVKTYKLVNEQKAGLTIVPNYFAEFHGVVASFARGTVRLTRMAALHYDRSNGIGVANTSTAVLGGKLYALCESDLPYEVNITSEGDLETIGRCDFGGKLHGSMTAHPKTDADTGEVFAFRNRIFPQRLSYFWFDADGNKQPDVPILSLDRPSFLHDFSITKKYAIFPNIQVGMDLTGFFTRRGPAAASDPKRVSRIGVIPRYAKDNKELRWFNVPRLNMFHIANAWDETDEKGDEYVVLVTPNVTPVEHMLEGFELMETSMEKIKINLKTGQLSRHPLCPRNLELATINRAYQGKKNRFVYAGVVDPVPKTSGLVKLDLDKAGSESSDRWDCTVASRTHGPGCYGSEPFFIAKEPENMNSEEEDDGYLVSYVHNENTGESKFIVMDAKSPSLDIVASIKLPQRVPYGFHGLFIREKDLRT